MARRYIYQALRGVTARKVKGMNGWIYHRLWELGMLGVAKSHDR